MTKKISLVLGSGGARGLAHIGVLRRLEESGYTISSLSGCSMGALIGGVYAIGKLDEFEEWIRSLSRIDILSYLDVSVSKGGFVKGDKIIRAMKELVGEKDIEDLSMKFTAVAVDIKKQKEVWIQEGPLFHAIRASISLPLFFTPVTDGNRLLIDGGVLNPVPIAPTFADKTDLTIAVNLGGPPTGTKQSPLEEQEEDGSFIQNGINVLLDKISDVVDKESSKWDVIEIVNRSFDAMQSTIGRQKLASYSPDIVITFPRDVCTIMEFDRADELINRGYEEADRVMTDIKKGNNGHF